MEVQDSAREDYEQAWKTLNRVTNSFDFNQDLFLSIDQDVPVGGVLSDEEILAELTPGPIEAPAEDHVESPPVIVSKCEAMKHLQGLKLFFMQSSEDKSDAINFLAGIEKDLEVTKVQSSIKSDFKF